MREDLEQYEYEERFLREYESFKNGNIREFKDFLHKLKGNQIYDFIKWLQSEDLKI